MEQSGPLLLIGAAQFATHFNLQGYETVKNTARHSFDYGLGILPEVFSGDINTKLGEAYHNQGFSVSGYIFPMVRGLIGLDVDALSNKVTFAPKLPADWKFLKVSNAKIGSAKVNFDLKIDKTELELLVTKVDGKDIQIEFMPELPLGTEIISAKLNNQIISPKIIRNTQSEQLSITLDLARESKITLEYKPAVAIYMLEQETPIGATNEGIKILSQELNGNKLTVLCEVKQNKKYEMGVVNGELIKSVYGAEYKNKKIIIENVGDEKYFVKHKFEIVF